jgi:hypothetical protein
VAGTLTWNPALDRPDPPADPVAAALQTDPAVADRVAVTEIDPDLADTAAFCEAYDVRPDLAAKRSGTTQLAACIVLATTRADVNAAVAACADAVIGSGVRRSKLLFPGDVLGGLPGAVVLADLGR